jgi:hypothetical protein
LFTFSLAFAPRDRASFDSETRVFVKDVQGEDHATMSYAGITRRDLEHAHHRFARIRDKAARDGERVEHLTGTAVQTGETVGTTFLLSLVASRFPNAGVAGVPLSTIGGLGGGALLHLLALFGTKKEDTAKHLHALGNGALAYYGAVLGAGVGTTMLLKQQAQPSAVTSGHVGALPGYRPGVRAYQATGGGQYGVRRALTPAELAALRRARTHAPGVHSVPMG